MTDTVAQSRAADADLLLADLERRLGHGEACECSVCWPLAAARRSVAELARELQNVEAS